MTKLTLSERIDRLEAQIASMQEALRSHDAEMSRRKMLSSEEATEFLRISSACLRQLCHRKKIPYYKPNGKNIYFALDELIAWQRKNHFEPEDGR